MTRSVRSIDSYHNKPVYLRLGIFMVFILSFIFSLVIYRAHSIIERPTGTIFLYVFVALYVCFTQARCYRKSLQFHVQSSKFKVLICTALSGWHTCTCKRMQNDHPLANLVVQWATIFYINCVVIHDFPRIYDFTQL